jgi:glycosyltransferase involved in cell wall biosynthesis
VVYVDSNSTDGSVAVAREMGATVVELDLSIPFTAARARNEGLTKLLTIDPACEFVQFVDGDCEIVVGWLERASTELMGNDKVAVVCGRRRERFPDASVYNRLCDMEWNLPSGDIAFCGGDAMMRVAALQQVGGYNATLIAGEEPEMCLRLRGNGWIIRGIATEMTLHDAAMMRFSQWWKRNVRAGHAFAEVSSQHAREPERFWYKDARSNWIWGCIVPLTLLALGWPTRGISLVGFGLYALLWFRIFQWTRRQGMNTRDAMTNAFFMLLGKFPQAAGQIKYLRNRLLGRRSRVIEYKGPAPAAEIPSQPAQGPI